MLLFFFNFTTTTFWEDFWLDLGFQAFQKNENRIHVSLRIPIRYNLYKWVISGVISPQKKWNSYGDESMKIFIFVFPGWNTCFMTWKPLDDEKNPWHLPKCRPFHRSGLVLLSGKLWLPGSRWRQNSIRKRHGGKATAKVGFSRWSSSAVDS